MAPYYWTILAVFLLTAFAKIANRSAALQVPEGVSYSRTAKLFLVIAVAVLVFVAGLRYRVGTDYTAYYRGLTLFGGRLEESLRSLDEPGLPLIATVISWFTDDGAYFIFVCAALTIMLCMMTNYKYTNQFVFVSMLFVFCGNWDGCFNGVRQYLAAAIVFAGHRLIYERKLVKYLLVVFLAFCVHSSAVIMIVPYFVLRNRINARNIILLIIGTAIVFLSYDRVFEFIGFLKDSEGEVGLTNYARTSVNILRTLVGCAPAVLCLVLYAEKKPNVEQTFYINALIIHATGRIATSNSAYLARLGIYTGLFVPLALAKLVKFDNKRLESLTKWGIVALYAIFWYVEISGSSSLSNFHWIWERAN